MHGTHGIVKGAAVPLVIVIGRFRSAYRMAATGNRPPPSAQPRLISRRRRHQGPSAELGNLRTVSDFWRRGGSRQRVQNPAPRAGTCTPYGWNPPSGGGWRCPCAEEN